MAKPWWFWEDTKDLAVQDRQHRGEKGCRKRESSSMEKKCTIQLTRPLQNATGDAVILLSSYNSINTARLTNSWRKQSECVLLLVWGGSGAIRAKDSSLAAAATAPPSKPPQPSAQTAAASLGCPARTLIAQAGIQHPSRPPASLGRC